MIGRAGPSAIVSRASRKSVRWTASSSRRAASSAASLTRLARSAPTRPGVEAATCAVRRLDGDPPIEAAGPEQRLVQHVRAVGRRQHDHRVARAEAVHLGQDLVERLLLLGVGAETGRTAPRAADGVELVDEDDGRGGLAGLLEQVAHAAGADPDNQLDELAG